jgi:hypothetical protein
MKGTIVVALVGVAILMTTPPAAALQGPPARPEAQAAPRAEEARERAGQQSQRPQEAQRPPQARGQGQPEQARGQGQRPPQARGQGQQPEQARGQAQRPPQAGQGPPAHARSAQRARGAPDVGAYNRGLAERVVETRARRHADAPRLEVRRSDGVVRWLRPDGQEVLSLRESVVDDLGYWRVGVAPVVGAVPVAPQTRSRYPTSSSDPQGSGSPAFCRSGEGHPVWGRNWCLDKGFGLGDRPGSWGVARTIEDVVLRRPDPRQRTLDQRGLAEVLGEVVFGRLALQSVVLGAAEPLTGTWLAEPQGPTTLRVMAGSLPVAELVDYDRNGRVDAVVFNLGR